MISSAASNPFGASRGYSSLGWDRYSEGTCTISNKEPLLDSMKRSFPPHFGGDKQNSKERGDLQLRAPFSLWRNNGWYESEIIHALESGNKNKFMAIVRQCCMQSRSWQCAMSFVVERLMKHGRVSALKFLLDWKLDLGLSFPSEGDIFLQATRFGVETICCWCLEKVAFEESVLQQAFILAFQSGQFGVVRLLLDCTNVDVRNVIVNYSPLTFALRYKACERAKRIIKASSWEACCEDLRGRNPLEMAVNQKNDEVLCLLIEKLRGHCEANTFRDLLFRAFNKGLWNSVRALISLKGILNIVFPDGDPAWLKILKSGRQELIEEMLRAQNKGSDLAEIAKLAIRYASLYGNQSLCEMALRTGASKESLISTIRTVLADNPPESLVSFICSLEVFKKNNDLLSVGGYAQFVGASEDVCTLFPRQTPLDQEALRRKLLAHLWDMKGVSVLGDNRRIELHGGFSDFFLPYILEGIEAFAQEYPQIISAEDKNFLLETLQYSHYKVSVDALMQRISQGKPVIMHTGYNTHVIDFVFWRHWLMICNRGAFSKRPVEVYHINRRAITPEVLKTLRERFLCDSQSVMNYFFPAFLRRLDAKLDHWDETLFVQWRGPRDQWGENCSWISFITSIFALLAVSHLLRNPKGPEHKIIGGAFEVYETWRQWFIVEHLRKYIKFHTSAEADTSMDAGLVSRIFAQALGRTPRGRINWRQDFRKRLEDLKKQFEETHYSMQRC